jgi:hypothetical protein
MAELRITIPDEWAPRVMEAIAALHGYTETLGDGTPNPETKAQFAKRIVGRWLKAQTLQFESSRAAAEAQTAKQAEFDSLDLG